jgi:hypothetical protein
MKRDGMEKADIVILNRRDRHGVAGSIYVGRAVRAQKGSSLGNPFPLESEEQREEVVRRYRRWLWDQVQAREGAAWCELVGLARRLKAGERLHLECWCAPRRCHAEVIADCLRWMVRKQPHG